jgi:hypothetical protein
MAGWVREDLRRRLPAHLVPGLLRVHDTLPLATSGKIDRRAVAALLAQEYGQTASQTAPAPAESPELALLLDQIRTLLRAPDFGPDDDFLAGGGDSLVALRVSGALRERGWRLRPSDLLTADDTRSAAARIRRR